MNRAERRASMRGRAPRRLHIDVTLRDLVAAAGPSVRAEVERAETLGGDRANLVAFVVHPKHAVAPLLTELGRGTGAGTRLDNGAHVMLFPRNVAFEVLDDLNADAVLHIRSRPARPTAIWCVVLQPATVDAFPLWWEDGPVVNARGGAA